MMLSSPEASGVKISQTSILQREGACTRRVPWSAAPLRSAYMRFRLSGYSSAQRAFLLLLLFDAGAFSSLLGPLKDV